MKQEQLKRNRTSKLAILGGFVGLLWLLQAPFVSAYTYFNETTYQIFAPNVTMGGAINEFTQASYTNTSITSENIAYTISKNFNFYDENYYPIINSIYSTPYGYMSACGTENNNISGNCIVNQSTNGVGDIINTTTYFNGNYVYIGTGYNTPRILFFTISNGLITGTYTPDFVNLVNVTTPPEVPIYYDTCDAVDIACYFRNALKWAFTLPTGSFNDLISLKNDIITKAPFGYVSSLFSVLGGLNDTTSPVFTLQEVTPITDLIFTPIKVALEWLLYFVFGFGLFIRFKDMQI